MISDNHVNQDLVEVLITLFKNNYSGNENAIKKDALTAHIVSNFGLYACERNVRHAIAFIRLNDMVKPGFIVSDVSAGYWLTSEESEMDDFLNKQLNRMTNQFQNIKQLHQRIRYAKNTGPVKQQPLF